MRNIEGKSALSRRSFVGKLAAGAAIACAAGATQAKALAKAAPSENSAGIDHELGSVAPRHTEAPPPPHAEASPPPPQLSAPSAPPPWELLRPLAIGSVLAHGWRVAGLTDVVDGSAVLTLENERGHSHRVHLCANDGRPQGLVYTSRVDLVVMNGGQGDLPTEEGLAQAVVELAHAVAANERDWAHEPMITELMPQTKRIELFASAAKLR